MVPRSSAGPVTEWLIGWISDFAAGTAVGIALLASPLVWLTHTIEQWITAAGITRD